MQNQNWSTYLGDPTKSQYSGLSQITKDNVSELELAWTYSSHDLDTNNRSQIQCNPLIIDGVLYGTSPQLKLFALNAGSGEELWSFDPWNGSFNQFGFGVNRGIAWHQDEAGARILFTAGPYLYAVNPETGGLIESFGENGRFDLHSGLDRDVSNLFINSSTPGLIYNDLLIIGSRVSESTGAAPGHIRAIDVYTADVEWIFHTIPHPGEYGYDSWPEDAYQSSGGANVWGGFSLDEDRGIVYCPTGSAAYDFYGGDRKGDNLFANCILALDANNGKRLWHYQVIHHDLWDKDLPVAPNLVTLNIDDVEIDALVQVTKNGLLYVLNRETGKPIYPIEEVEVPPSILEGESVSPSQPVPTIYPAFSRTDITMEDLAIRNSEAATFARHIFETTNHNGLFDPPSENGTIIFPGFDGGGEWGGAAYDPVNNDLIVNSNEIPWLCTMDKVVLMGKGEGLYKALCQSCHGEDFEGNQIFGNIPSIRNLKMKYDVSGVAEIIKNGKGAMPGFSWITEDRIEAIFDFINGEENPNEKIIDNTWPYPYRMRGYEKLYASDGFPIIKPPWGQLTSINLEKAEINWQIPLGSYSELEELGLQNTGTENYGGPVLTASGIIFIAASSDEKFRIFDADDGKLLWEYKLPAAGYATPAVYAVNGKQFVVIACGGGKLNTKSGDQYLAFALTE